MEAPRTNAAPEAIFFTELIIWNILSHVPTKSLMRFKSVSKSWHSIIRSPDFAKYHSSRSGSFKGLLITDFIAYYPQFYYENGLNRVFYANFNADNCNKCSRLSCYEHFTWDLSEFWGVTPVVKGLIGLYNDQSFTLCNVATKEMVKLPGNSEAEEYDYHLGYDPVMDVYKVLKLVFHDDSVMSSSAEIFTIGRASDLAWRSVDQSLVYCETQSLCIDGRLYWLPGKGATEEVLIVFHLGSESFETIPLQDISAASVSLTQIDRSPALILFGSDDGHRYMGVWMMKNDARGGFEGWVLKKYRLPVDDLLWAGTLPNGEMLVAQSQPVKYPMLIFKYEHSRHEMKLITLYGPGEPQKDGVVDYDSIQMCYHEENIIALAPLLGIQQQRTIAALDSVE